MMARNAPDTNAGSVPPPALDRRSNTRPADPPCPTCHASPEEARVTIRTSFLMYFKCGKCGDVWQAKIPPQRSRQRWDVKPPTPKRS
jgi:hypothetical protein